MKMLIESTPHIVNLDGAPARVWNGMTASGVRCTLFVHRIAVHESLDASEFERELREEGPPVTVSLDRALLDAVFDAEGGNGL